MLRPDEGDVDSGVDRAQGLTTHLVGAIEALAPLGGEATTMAVRLAETLARLLDQQLQPGARPGTSAGSDQLEGPAGGLTEPPTERYLVDEEALELFEQRREEALELLAHRRAAAVACPRFRPNHRRPS